MAVKRTRTKKAEIKEVSEPKVEVIENPVEVKPKWKVRSGGITLLDRRKSYSKGDVFEADEWAIPDAFRDLVELMTPLSPRKKKVVLRYFVVEVVPTAEEQDAPDYVQKYVVLNEDDKHMTEVPVTKEEAEALVKSLKV